MAEVPLQIRNLIEKSRQVEETRRVVDRLEARMGRINREVEGLAQTREITANSNLIFTWTDATTTFSWGAGYVRDKDNAVYHVPAGSRAGLAANTYYWFGWNPVHQTMSVVTDIAQLSGIPNVIIITNIRSSAAGLNGVGGPGTFGSGATPADLLGQKFVVI